MRRSGSTTAAADGLPENGKPEGAVFDGAELADVCFYGVDFERAEFRSAEIRNATFVRCNLKNADFDFADMRGVKFIRCRLEGSSYDCAFGDVVFADCTLNGAGFHHSGLELTMAGSSAGSRGDDADPAADPG